MTTQPKHHYTDRVGGRTALAAELLKPKHAERIAEAHILPRDLQDVVTHGQEAERQDRLQKEALAEQYTDLEAQKELRDEFDDGSEKLRNCLPAVVRDLLAVATTRALGQWLSKVSFTRYRLTLPKEEAAGGSGGEPLAGDEPEAAPKAAPADRTLVERRDRLAVAQASKQLTEALLAEGREPIVAALTERGLTKERLEWLRDQATAQQDALGGVLRIRATEATERESEAVGQQKEAWESSRRMIRSIVGSDPDLQNLWARC